MHQNFRASDKHTAPMLRCISEINLKLLDVGDALHIFGGPAGDKLRDFSSKAKKVRSSSFLPFIPLPKIQDIWCIDMLKNTYHGTYQHAQISEFSPKYPLNLPLSRITPFSHRSWSTKGTQKIISPMRFCNSYLLPYFHSRISSIYCDIKNVCKIYSYVSLTYVVAAKY